MNSTAPESRSGNHPRISMLILAVLLTVSLPGTGCVPGKERRAGSSATGAASPTAPETATPGPATASTAHALLGGEGNPFLSEASVENRFLYLDASRSALGGVLAAWESVSAEASAFLRHSSPGSRLEIYRTDASAGHPVLLFARTIPKGRPVVRREFARLGERELAELHDALQTAPPRVPGSFIIEDTRRIASRAGSLTGPSALLVYTDAEQWSPFLRDGQVLAVMKNAGSDSPSLSGEETSSDEASGEAQLIATLARRMPPLTKPPQAIFLLYVAPRSGQGPLRGDEGEARTRFLKDLFATWGTVPARITVEEPFLLHPQEEDGFDAPAIETSTDGKPGEEVGP